MSEITWFFDDVVVVYFVALNLVYTGLLLIGSRQVAEWVLRRPMRDFRAVGRSELSLPVTIVVPAYNEEPCIVESVRSLLMSRYRELEVVVVNDGSNDGTLDALREGFGLAEIERVPRSYLETEPVRAVYASPDEPRLLVVDKDNGGKADALNVGIRYASYPLFCAIDSDTMLDHDALARLVWAFQAQPEMVANGGIVRILNGSAVGAGRVQRVRTPSSLVVNIQIMEYLRAFLCARAGWSRLNMLLIISGAFGLFRRETVVDAGGYDTTTVGEDAELIFRLHKHCRDRKMKYRISFVADPICWTEAPASLKVLARQRDRWQRGLLEVLWRYRSMMLRPKYGRIGMVGLPYFLVFEALGPIIELAGLLFLGVGLVTGALHAPMAVTLIVLAFSYGLVLSYGALLIEERAFQRYPDFRCLRRLMLAAIVENFGYKQYMALVRARACWTVFRSRHAWGEMTRAGFGAGVPAPEPVSEPAAARA